MGNVATAAWRWRASGRVITLFAFFDPMNIGERLFSKDADDDNLKTSPMSIFKDDGWWKEPLEIRRRDREDAGAVVASIFAL